jgi:D-proline reductase (dithiol) PrdB
VCHQTVSLVARHLEANGIPTVTIGSARDIVEHCGVPRLLFVDFPLGNPCGVPGDLEMQRGILDLALDLLVDATAPRTTVRAPFAWPRGDDWKEKVLTQEQPFLDAKQTDSWLAAKADYQRLRVEGKV